MIAVFRSPLARLGILSRASPAFANGLTNPHSRIGQLVSIAVFYERHMAHPDDPFKLPEFLTDGLTIVHRVLCPTGP